MVWQRIKNVYHLFQALVACLFFGFPAQKLKVIGVTGTDGKTTTVHMIWQVLTAAGFKTGLISSLGAKFDEKIEDTGFHVTTPSPFALQRLLAKMVDEKTEFAVLEVTSHGLDQNRVAFIPFEVGVLTNVNSEHLDYHKTFENYLKAKGKLFQIAKVSILNVDDISFEKLEKKVGGQLVTYGIKNKANLALKNFPLKLKIPGDYNYYNALAAAACCGTLGVQPLIIKKTLENFLGLPGRMEEVKNNLGIKIYIDFAHTPNALEQVLKTLNVKRKTQNAKIISVFGAAGERDKLKRPLMGEISAKLANITIVTAEDPRHEDPAQICQQILFGAKKEGGTLGKNIFVELDREKAIKLAIKLARSQDIVAIFGKGAEKSMAYGKAEIPWSDKGTVIRVLKSIRK